MPLTTNVVNACPAGIVTLAGTVAWVVSPLDRATANGSVVSVLRVTVAVIWLPARTAAIGKVTVRAGPSASRKTSEAEASPAVSTTPALVSIWAVSTAVLSPVTSPSSRAVMGNVAEACPRE